MKDIDVVRWNEKVRTVSRAFMQVGTALGSAGAVKAYLDNGFSLAPIGWIVVAGAAISVGLKVLDLLESEE